MNARQKQFAALYHRYGNATRAYGEAYDAPRTETGAFPHWVTSDGNRLVRNGDVQAEIDRLKGEAAALASMTLEQTTDWLVAAITTPVAEIGPDSPLCEEYEVKPDGSIKTKSVSKIAAARELIRLTGMDSPVKVEVSAKEDFLTLFRSLTGVTKPTEE
jgi:hypothetical protein